MGPIIAAAVAVGLVGVAATVYVLYREGHLDGVPVPRWAGWRIDVDDAYDVWPVEHDLIMVAALHAEADHRVPDREESR